MCTGTVIIGFPSLMQEIVMVAHTICMLVQYGTHTYTEIPGISH